MPITLPKRFGRERGDTLIEVIFATATLSLVIVVAMIVMNQGTASSERAVEGTFVRQSIDSQAEMLRYARDGFIDKSSPALWSDIVTSYKTTSSAGSSSVTGYAHLASSCQPTNSKAFYLVENAGSVVLKTDLVSPVTYASAGKGVWIEATSSDKPGYVDFYIYGCWESPVSGPNATSATVVRLYAPTT